MKKFMKGLKDKAAGFARERAFKSSMAALGVQYKVVHKAYSKYLKALDRIESGKYGRREIKLMKKYEKALTKVKNKSGWTEELLKHYPSFLISLEERDLDDVDKAFIEDLRSDLQYGFQKNVGLGGFKK